MKLGWIWMIIVGCVGTSQAGVSLTDLQTRFQERNWSSVIQGAETFEQGNPAPIEKSQALNLRGMSYLLTDRPLLASLSFQRAIEFCGDDAQLCASVNFNYGASLHELARDAQAIRALTKVAPDALDPETRVKFVILRAQTLDALKRPDDAVQALLESAALLTAPTVAPDMVQLSRTMTENLSGRIVTELDSPIARRLKSIVEAAPESPLKDIAAAKLAAASAPSIAAAAGMPSNMVAAATEADGGKRGVVGVLLPMTGRYAKFGQQALRGIETAFRIYTPNERDLGFRLVVEDTGDDLEQGRAALRRLVKDQDVIAVLGPLLSKGQETIAQEANDLGVPTLSLTSGRIDSQDALRGGYYFQSGVPTSEQVEAIAKFAVKEAGLKRFAIVYPNDAYGREQMHAFWDQVELLGGEVVDVASYSSKDTDFRSTVDRLVGYADLDARKLEAASAARERNKLIHELLAKDPQSKEAKILERKARDFNGLPPRVDFDAVFLPDEARMAGLLLPTFLFRDVADAKFLGLSNWNSPSLVERAGSASDRAFFVDTFHPQGAGKESKQFVERFQKTYGAVPSAIEAASFDMANLLQRTLVGSSSLSRSDVRNRLQKLKEYSGVTGKIRFEEGAFRRPLKIFRVVKREIQQVNP